MTTQQTEKLSDLFMDLGKGLLLAAFAAPLLTATDFGVLFKLFFSGIMSVYFSLKLIAVKG